MKKLAIALILLSASLGLAGINIPGGGTGGSTIPPVAGNAGKFLNTDGSITQWLNVPGGGDMLRANNLSDVLSAATSRTNLGLAIGTNVQAFDTDLTTWAGITPSPNVQTFLGAANYAAMRVQLSLVPGTDVQAWDADLDALAALTLTDTIFYRSAANTWTPVTIGANLTFLGGTLSATSSVAASAITFSDPDNNFSATNVEAAIAEFNAVDGSGPNTATAKVDWSQIGNMPAGFADGTDDGGGVGGADADAIHDNVSGEINAITAKATPVGADLLVSEDSAASFVKKKLTIASLEPALEAVIDLQDLQGAVTDAQVPDTITVNTANSGDSATAFFTVGQIERARGGTGADTSAYGAALFGSNGSNATIAVNTVPLLETALGGANIIDGTELNTIAKVNALVADGNFVPDSRQITINGTANEITSSAGSQDLSADRTWTISLPSAIDLGGKTSLEIPNSAAPTVNTFGQIAGDSNLWGVNRGAPVFFDGTDAVALIGALVSDTPTDGQIPRFNSSAGTVTWETFTTSPGGSDTQLQYNNAGSLAGTAGLTWNNSTNTLSVTTLTATTLNATGLRILDNVDQSHAMVIVNNQDLTADINLNVSTGGATRNLSIPGNATISGTNTGDQTITLTGPVTGSGTGSIATTLAASQTVTSWTLVTPTIGAATWQDGVRQTFNPDNTNAGLNVGSNATDPSSPSNGDVWYDSGNNTLDARINGATVNLGSGSGAPTGVNYLVGTADVTLTAEIVVGTTPGGELGGTWASPTLDDGVTVDAWTMGASFGTTPTANDNTTKLATTAYVQTELTAYASDTVAFSNKTSTTESAGDNDTSIATTAFVQAAARDALGGTHSSPLTGAQSPTWNSVTEVLFYGATGTITLPTAASYAGRSIVIYNTGAFTITIDSTGSEVLVRDGTVQTGGVSMTLSTGAGNYVALVCDGVRWITLGFKGTLAVGS